MIGYLISFLLGAICAMIAIAFLMGHSPGFAHKFQKIVDAMGDETKPATEDGKKD